MLRVSFDSADGALSSAWFRTTSDLSLWNQECCHGIISKKLRWDILRLLQQLNSYFNCLLRVVSVSCTEQWLIKGGPDALYWIFYSQNQGNFPGVTPKWIVRLEPYLWSKVNLLNSNPNKIEGKEKASGWNRSFREKGSKKANPCRNVAGNGPRQFVSPQIHLLSLLYFLLYRYSFLQPAFLWPFFAEHLATH